MKTWLIINSFDANNTFEVEGNTAEEAAFAALDELGWGVAEKPAEDDDETGEPDSVQGE